MTQSVPEFEKHRVLVLGDAMLDEYVSGDCSRLSPEAPVPVLRVLGARQVLGGAANSAANVTSLGGLAVLIALVGSDVAGEELSRLARSAGIEFEGIRDGRPTLRKMRVVGQHQQLVRLDYEDLAPISSSTEARVLELFDRHVRRCDIVVISDYAKGLLTSALCQEIISLAHHHGRHVIVDPRPAHRDFYLGCDYLTPNWKEAQGLLGCPDAGPAGRTSDGVRMTGLALTHMFHANALLTLGALGMAFFGRDGEEHFAFPTSAREVFDVSGAGDTVVSVFALARAAGAGHRTAVALANRAAGIVVGKFGTATVTREELFTGDDGGARIVGREELAGLCATLRATGKKIVTINGAFDLLHAGHLHILREAKRLGDVLIVGLNTDESVRVAKGPHRPVVPQERRAEMLLALRYVDYVHVFPEAVPMPFLEQIRPDVHVNGAEYGVNCVEAETVERLGGRLHLVERIPDCSTTQLVDRLKTQT